LSDDEDDDDVEAQAQRKLHERAVSPGGPASTSITDQAFAPPPRDDSSRRPPPSRPRESLDGETIFAVGEGEDWSDGDDSDIEEHGRLTKKI